MLLTCLAHELMVLLRGLEIVYMLRFILIRL